MRLEVDLRCLPPVVAVREPENVRELKAVVITDGHAYIPEAELRSLVRDAAGGTLPAGYEGMIAYAAEHGWRRDDGAIRVHVEPPPEI